MTDKKNNNLASYQFICQRRLQTFDSPGKMVIKDWERLLLWDRNTKTDELFSLLKKNKNVEPSLGDQCSSLSWVTLAHAWLYIPTNVYMSICLIFYYYSKLLINKITSPWTRKILAPTNIHPHKIKMISQYINSN